MVETLRIWWPNYTNDIRKGVGIMRRSLVWDVGRELRQRQRLPFISTPFHDVVAHSQGHVPMSTEEA